MCAAGTLQLFEPAVTEPDFATKLRKLGIELRTERLLKSDLVVNGFVDIVTERLPISDVTFRQWLGIWDIAETPELMEMIKDDIFIYKVSAKKPNYKSGTSGRLSFAKPKVAAVTNVEEKKIAAMVWTIDANDEDAELEDEEALLDEEDMIIPPTAPSGDCSTKKRGMSNLKQHAKIAHVAGQKRKPCRTQIFQHK